MSVLQFPSREKQIHVRVRYAHWRGDSQVEPEDSAIIVVIEYEFNGFPVSDSAVVLEFDTFASATLAVPEDHPEIPDDINESNRLFHERCIKAFRDTLTASDWLDGTTDDVLVVPVSRLEMIERPASEWGRAKG